MVLTRVRLPLVDSLVSVEGGGTLTLVLAQTRVGEGWRAHGRLLVEFLGVHIARGPLGWGSV